MDGEAVLETVQPARVLGDVPADGARDLRGRVRRVVEPVRTRRLGDGEVAYPWLHPGETAIRIELQDPVELREAEEQSVLQGQGAPGKAGAGAAGDHRNALRGRRPHDALHVLHPIRQYREHRQAAIDGEPVALEGAKLLRLGEHRVAGEEGEELGGDLGAADRARRLVEGKGSSTGHRNCPAAPRRPFCRAGGPPSCLGSMKA